MTERGEPLREFGEAVRISGLREAQVFGEAVPGNWAAALRQLAGVLPADGPSIVVLDELPYGLSSTSPVPPGASPIPP